MAETVTTRGLFGGERPVWTMPEWMEPYRDMLPDGRRAEELMNSTATTFENDVLALMAVDMKSAVTMLTRLHNAGLLRPTDPPEPASAAPTGPKADKQEASSSSSGGGQ